MSQQGKALSSGQKWSIISLKKYFDEERKMGSTVSTKDSIGRISRSLDIGRRTVETILAEYNKNDQKLIESLPKSRGKPPLKVSDGLISNIRSALSIFNIRIQGFQFTSSIFDGELPIDSSLPAVAGRRPSISFLSKDLNVWNAATRKALTCHRT